MSLNDYRILKKLGEGAFGKVYLAQLRSSHKQYVIKEVEMKDQNTRAEALKEVKFLKQLSHPNIIAYRDFFEGRGQMGQQLLYIVMAFADGGDLEQQVKKQSRRRGGFSERQILDWFVQICLGLKHMHDRKILHRDIKTQNIFLTLGNTVKLGDFGVARDLTHTLEKARTQIGTPYYLSPEICNGQPYDHKSDMWSMGVVLYELMCLKYPFTGNSLPELVRKICAGRYSAPPAHTYGKELRSLCASLLNPKASQRPGVNDVLATPFIQKQIKRFLSTHILEEEFSHTLLHRDDSKNKAHPVLSPVHQQPVQQPAPIPGLYAAPAVVRPGVPPPRPAVRDAVQELERMKRERNARAGGGGAVVGVRATRQPQVQKKRYTAGGGGVGTRRGSEVREIREIEARVQAERDRVRRLARRDEEQRQAALQQRKKEAEQRDRERQKAEERARVEKQRQFEERVQAQRDAFQAARDEARRNKQKHQQQQADVVFFVGPRPSEPVTVAQQPNPEPVERTPSERARAPLPAVDQYEADKLAARRNRLRAEAELYGQSFVVDAHGSPSPLAASPAEVNQPEKQQPRRERKTRADEKRPSPDNDDYNAELARLRAEYFHERLMVAERRKAQAFAERYGAHYGGDRAEAESPVSAVEHMSPPQAQSAAAAAERAKEERAKRNKELEEARKQYHRDKRAMAERVRRRHEVEQQELAEANHAAGGLSAGAQDRDTAVSPEAVDTDHRDLIEELEEAERSEAADFVQMMDSMRKLAASETDEVDEEEPSVSGGDGNEVYEVDDGADDDDEDEEEEEEFPVNYSSDISPSPSPEPHRAQSQPQPLASPPSHDAFSRPLLSNSNPQSSQAIHTPKPTRAHSSHSLHNIGLLEKTGKFTLLGSTLQLSGVGEDDSLSYKVEALRMFLGRQLGDDRLLECIRSLRVLTKQEPASRVRIAELAMPIVGPLLMSADALYAELVVQLYVSERMLYGSIQ